jgi:TolB-like protein/Tfp pilus assembly protein PilF
MNAIANPRKVQFGEFGEFSADLQSGELRRSGHAKPTVLPEQPLQVLQTLLKRPGEMVTRDELIRTLWPGGGFGDFDHGLNKVMNRLRDVLGDSADSPKFIETVARRGYRFIAPVTTGAATPTVGTAAGITSLAVLPLVNASGDPETEYLSDGISESIINSLSRFPSLRVIPRTSAFRFRGREADLKKVGRDLKVRAVLTGKVIQRGEKLVVQTELVDVASGAQLWGGQFNPKLEDIFEVQEEIARQISENLRLRLTPEDEKRLAKRSTQSREAYQFFLKAQYHTNKMTSEGYQRGMEYARQAIEADPGYADAYVRMAGVYLGLGFIGFLPPADGFPKAKAAVLKALEINDSLAEAHAFLAAVMLYYDWDWSGAEHACKRALELNPNYAEGHNLWGDWLLIMGRQEEAMAENQLAVELDPLSAGRNFNFGQKLLWSGDFERAIEQFKKALEFDAGFTWAHIGLSRAYASKGMYEESFAGCKKVATLFGSNPLSRALRSLILAMAGKTDEAKAILNELSDRPELDPMALIYSAESSSVLGEKDRAFQFLEAAYEDRVSLLMYLDARPAFNNIRSDPRFADLRRRIGLPGDNP